MQGTVVPYVQGLLPEHSYSVGTSTVDQPTNVALLLALPSAQTASPPGPGGGWVDGTPWPSTGGNTQIPVVSGLTSSTSFQVNCPTGVPGPTAGVTHISYISPNTWTMCSALVLTASVASGHLWNITIDTPFPDVFVGAYIFPQSVQQANYLDAVFEAFSNLGPGEWTVAPAVIGRAFRHPPPTLSWPNTLDANFLRVIENAGQEVKTSSFLTTGSASTPAVPASITVSGAGVLLRVRPPRDSNAAKRRIFTPPRTAMPPSRISIVLPRMAVPSTIFHRSSDATTDRPAAGTNPAYANVAAMTRTATRAWAQITPGTSGLVSLTAHNANWGNGAGVTPGVTCNGVGKFLVTWPTTVSDEIPIGSPGYVGPHTVNFRGCVPPNVGGSVLYYARSSVIAANQIQTYTYSASGTLASPANTPIDIFGI